MLASTAPVNFQLARLGVLHVHHRDHAADHGRELDHAALVEFGRRGGLSEAPKSTVFAVICLIPPPEPMDW